VTPAPNLRSIVDGVRRVVRRDAVLALALLVLSALPAALLAAWIAGLLRPWSRPGFGPLAFDALIVAGAGALLWLGVRRWLRRIDEVTIAADAERRAGMPAGTVRGVLELSRQVPDGTSPALARRAEYEIASRFSGLQPRDIAGEFGTRVRRRRGAAAAVFTVLTTTVLLLAFAAPEHSRASWAPLASPVSNLKQPLLPPLRVLPGNASVVRGASLAVQIEAEGRDIVTLRWRTQGDVPREEIAGVSAGRALAEIPRIDAPTEYWLEAPDGASSPRFRITPIDPLLVADLSVDVVYPRHVGRAADRYTGDVPPLEVPEGTQLIVRGRATRELQAAELVVSDDARMRFSLEGDGFSGSFTPGATARYEWRLQDVRGDELAVQPAPLDITVVADGAPLVEIAWPERDTILDGSLRQSVVADARDDYGLTSAALVSWRIGSDGRRYPEVEDALPLPGDDRALIRALLDASTRELVPGDTLKFYVRVTDNSPRRQSAVSRTVTLRLPHAGELREMSVERADTLVSQAAALAKSAAELQNMMRTLERRTAASNARQRAQQQQSGGRSSPGAANERMSFQDAAQARQLMERQDELLQRIESMRRNIAELERAMERAGLRDAQLQERLAELREMYEETLTPEVKQQMEQLRRALEQMDPEELQRVLEQMTRQQEQMKQQLEAGVEMMKQAAAEQEMNNLAQEARELATQQQALAEAIREQGRASPEQARAQQELAKRSEQLSQELADMQQRLEQHGETDAAEQTKAAEQAAREAGQQMQQAARDAQRDGSNAAQSGDRAAEQLEKAAENLDRARQSLADSRRQEAQESVQQAMSEALSLAQRQQQLLDQMKEAEASAQQGDSVQVVKPPQQPGAPQLPRPPEPQVRIGSERQQEQQRSGEQQGQQQQGQQGGQQQQGQQQQGQQGGQQQQGAQQQGQQGQQQGGQQRGQQGEGQRAGEQGQQGAGERGDGRQGQSGQQGQGAPDSQGMRAEQTALRQGLQQLSRNLQEAAERTGGMNRDVSASLARANLSMEQTLQAMENGTMPIQQAQQTVESLNRLALSLLTSAQQMDHSEAGAAGQQATQQQLADLAKQQGSLNGQANSLQPMNLSAGAMSQQLNRLAQEQMEIARRLGNLNQGGNAESIMGDVDALAGEAEELSRRMRSGSGLSPEVLARQERLFHRLLDAGRTLEKDEYEEERAGERARAFDPRNPGALDPRIFQDPTRFRAPTQEELQALPPAYRRMILDYFERLNRTPAPATGGTR
jgi:hypothetical protein